MGSPVGVERALWAVVRQLEGRVAHQSLLVAELQGRLNQVEDELGERPGSPQGDAAGPSQGADAPVGPSEPQGVPGAES